MQPHRFESLRERLLFLTHRAEVVRELRAFFTELERPQ
jgi:hypothetical protein